MRVLLLKNNNSSLELRHSAGFSVVELLVTLAVISVGVLGTAALQARSAQTSRTAYYRSQAAVLGQQILEAMRANHDVVASGAYNTGFTDAVSCDADATLPECDLALWKSAITSRLPDGQGRVSFSSTDVVTICIRWKVASRQYQVDTLADDCTQSLDGYRQYELETVL